MLRWRLVGIAVTVMLLAAGGALMRIGARGAPIPAGPAHAPTLHLFWRSPVLVRAGERVTVPVDVACAWPDGAPCAATVTMQVGDGEVAAAPARPGLEFDLTAPAARAAGGRLEVRVAASAAGAGTVAYPSSPSGRLDVYVTGELPVLRVPAVPFGSVRTGTVVLALPWGSGPLRAGLDPGRESAVLGPPSFDVDGAGRVHLLDAMQDRLAVFEAGRLVRTDPVSRASEGVVATTPDGADTVVSPGDGGLVARSFTAAGRSDGERRLGPGLVSQVRSAGDGAYGLAEPMDAWVPLDHEGSPSVGAPTPSGLRLLRAGRDDRIRLGTVREGVLRDAVELRSNAAFGEVALAEPDPRGGYLVVARTWRGGPRPAEQFQVIRIAPDHAVETFAVADREYADVSPLARFRLGADGALYQMTSSPEGVQIVRFELRGEDR